MKCPECNEPNVHPMSVVQGRAHYRCPECLWSWHSDACVCEPGNGSCDICRAKKGGV